MSHTNPSTEQDIHYDVRVVRLAKSTQDTRIYKILEKMEWIHNKCKKDMTPSNLNLCLGHFDVMIIDQVSSCDETFQNPLHNVIEDYQQNRDLGGILASKLKEEPENEPLLPENGSYYPIYMLLQKPSARASSWDKDLEEFWAKERNYTVVMRLHQIPNNSENFDSFRKQLIRYLRGQDTDTSPCVALENSIDCIFYDSMELGDVVCILKGDLLAHLLEIQRRLYEASSVSSSYSYCGIRFDLPTKANQEDTGDMEALKQSKLPYVETRYSVKNPYLASHFLQGNAYFVTGSVDALILRQDRSEFDLLKDLHSTDSLNQEGDDHTYDFYEMFHNVVTRVGLENRKMPAPGDGHPGNPALYPPIRLKRGFLNWLKSEYGKSNNPDGAMYAYSLERLVSSLNAMSANSVTDALAMLMYKGIKALIEQLEHYSEIAEKEKNKDKITEWDRVSSHVLETLQTFLDEWTSATNEILHLESQLFQQPELIPVRVYIPAMILQFQLLIVEKAMKVVNMLEDSHDSDHEKKSGDAANKPEDNHGSNPSGGYEYIPIMLPSSQQHTDTIAIFDPRREESYTKQSPLCIHVPIHMLYHPYRISLILCHEIAHYCGNEIRHRETRNKALFNCMSFYAATRMIQSLDLLDSKDDPRAGGILGQILPCVERAKRQFGHILKDEIKSGYLSDVAEAFEKHIPSLMQDPALLNGIVYELLSGFEDIHKQVRICDDIQMEGYTTIQEDARFCIEHLNCCLLELFRECFADLVMILLTGCSFRHYYLRVIHDEYLNLQSQGKEKDTKLNALREQWMERHSNRMTLVAMAINNLHKEKNLAPWWVQEEDVTRTPAYRQAVQIKIGEWNKQKYTPLPQWKNCCGDKDTDSYLLTGYEANEILRYLTECAIDIYDRLHRDSGTTDKSTQEKTVSQQVRELKNLINMLMSGSIDWDELQKQLHISRIEYLETINKKQTPQQQEQ